MIKEINKLGFYLTRAQDIVKVDYIEEMDITYCVDVTPVDTKDEPYTTTRTGHWSFDDSAPKEFIEIENGLDLVEYLAKRDYPELYLW